MSGRFCRVEPIDSARHGAALYTAYGKDREGRLWTYLPWGPYSGPEELCARIDAVRASGVRPEYAILISATLRGSYHLYQGFGGFLGNAVMGLIFGTLFLRWRRVTPMIIAHTLIDAVAFIGYALLVGHVSWLV